MIDPSLQNQRPSKWRYPLRSLFFHVGILLLLVTMEIHFRHQDELEELKKVLEVRPLTEEEFKKLFPGAQVVETSIDPKLLSHEDRAATKFLGEKKQRVKQQTVAPLRDLREREGPQSGRADKLKGSKKSASKTPLAKNKDGFGEPVSGEQRSQLQRSSPSSNQILDPSIKISTITLLNTDEYMYASFYNRMRDSFAARWREFLSEYFDVESNAIRIGIYKTDAQFILAKNGEIRSVKLLSSSSIPELDKLGMRAIQETKWLQNPPTDLFEGGQSSTELKFTFMLSVQPSKGYQFHFIPDRRLLRRR